MAITNAKVGKVYKKKTGTSQGEHGSFEWAMYNVQFEGDGNYYTYFHSGKKPIIKQGDIVLYAEVDTKIKGKYTNYEIKDIKLQSNTSPEQQNTPQDRSKPETPSQTYINHGEVMVRLMEQSDGTQDDLKRLIRIFNSGIHYMATGEKASVGDFMGASPGWGNNSDPGFNPDDIPDSELPF